VRHWYYGSMPNNMKDARLASGFLCLFCFTLALTFPGVASCASPLAWSAYDDSLSSLDAHAWKSDLSSLEHELLKHPKLRADAAAAERLHTAISLAMSAVDGADTPASRRDAAIAGIAKACASVGDGHTRINASPSLRFPVALRFYPVSSAYDATDYELRVYASSPEFAFLLGKKVEKIQGLPVDAVLKALEPAVSLESALDEPGAEALKGLALRTESLSACMDPFLMRGLGLADKEGLHLTIDASDYTVPETSESFAWSYAIAPDASTAIARRHPDTPIWYSILDTSPDTLYLAFRSCRSDAGTVFDEVIRTLHDHAEITRLIVDMRTNSGGDSRPGTRFAQQLSGTSLAKRRGGVVLLVGPYTFSSALMNAADILKACGAKGDPNSGNAVLAGEPLTEPLDHYGEVVRYKLPSSGLVVGRSSKFFRYSATSGLSPKMTSSAPQVAGSGARLSESMRAGVTPCWTWCSLGIDLTSTCTVPRRAAV